MRRSFEGSAERTSRHVPSAFLVGLVCAGLLAACSAPTGDQSTSSSSTGAQSGDRATNWTFTDVTESAGLSSFRHVTGAFGERWFPEAMGAGCGFIDYDGDGWLDVVLVSGGIWERTEGEASPALRVYRNDRDGTFTEVTEEVGLAEVHAYGFGVSAADYDEDGDQDLFLSTLRQNYLFRNDGGRFTDVTEEAGLGDEEVWSTSSIFFDADRDGDLDLYVGSYVRWSPENDRVCTVDGEIRSYCTPLVYDGIPGRYYENQGDGTFEDRTEQAGFGGSPGKTLGVSLLDFNDDGWMDLIVANDTHRNLLYENQGDGTFVERGQTSGIAYDENGSARAGMGIDVGVVDTTGEPTVAVGNFSKEMIGVFRHTDGGLFQNRAAISGIGSPTLVTLTFGLFYFDADLDGDLDIFAANGHVQPEIEEATGRIRYAEASHLFLNDGTGTFEDAASDVGSPLTDRLVARGAAYGDYDRDGDLDVLVTENGGRVHLWRNDRRERSDDRPHYLRVEVQGSESNRDGIGTQVTAYAGNRAMYRRVRTGSSFLAQLEKTVTFGLGDAEVVDSLRVDWPSGRTDRFEEVGIDRMIRVREGGSRTVVWEDGSRSNSSGSIVQRRE